MEENTEILDDEVAEVYLSTKNDAINPFFSMNKKNQEKVIELGLIFYKYGSEKIQFWNNSKWEDMIQEMEFEQKKRISELDQQILNEKEKCQNMIHQHKEEKSLIVSEIRTSESAKYSSEIERLKSDNREKDEQISLIHNKFLELHTTLSDKNEIKTEELRKKYEEKITRGETKLEELRESYEEKLQKEKDKYENTIVRTQNSTIKGQDGEDFTFHQLNCMFPRSEIEDCHKQSARGDFIMREKDFTMMIETKNYDTNVNKVEIEKFYRDVRSDANSDIQCAILVSLKSGISNRKDFAFEIVNNKPVLFLHKVFSNMKHLELAVLFLKVVLQEKNIDFTNKEKIDVFKNMVSSIKRNFTRQKKRIDKFSSEQMKDIIEQETFTRSLFNQVNINY